jgi:predicted ester cyclase
MSTDENKQLVLRWKEEIWNRRNLGIIDELFAPDYVGHVAGLPGDLTGRDGLRKFFSSFLGAFETRETPGFLIAEGEFVAMYDTYWARSTASFQGSAPTGREATTSGIDIYHIVDGKVVEQWFEGETTNFLRELGVGSLEIPAAAQ